MLTISSKMKKLFVGTKTNQFSFLKKIIDLNKYTRMELVLCKSINILNI